MNKITIVPSYARNSVMKDIISHDNNPFDKQVLSLSAFKNSLLLEPMDSNQEEAYLFNDIKNNIDKNNIFYNQLSFPVFFKYFYDFSKLLIRYGIRIDDLPEDSDQDKSKKEILSYFLNKNLIEKQITDSIDKTDDFDNVEILDYFYYDLADQIDIDKLVEKKAKFISHDRNNNTQYICRYANNPVKEVIGIAQEFIRKEINISECVIMLNDKNTYVPIIRRIFEYYKIPYVVDIRKSNNEAQRFLALLKFIRKQDMKSFIQAYNYRCFNNSDYILIDYINAVNLNFDQLYEPLNKINKLTDNKNNKEYIAHTFGSEKISKLQEAETKCEMIMSSVRTVMNKIKEYKDKPLYVQCTYVYNYLYSKVEKESLNKETVKEIQDIHSLCMSLVNKENDNFKLLAYELSKLDTRQHIEYEEGIRIVDVNEDIKGYDKAIILGCVQQNYPKTIAMSGFFDEEYLSRINNYPSLIERSDYYNKQYDKLLKNFKEVTFSYPVANIDGDQYQRSILISDYVESVKVDDKKVLVESPWKYSEKEEYYDREEAISEDIAKKLYLKDGVLSASPSGFEKYVKCPFAYFIEKGLKIKDEEKLSIDASTIGSIQHHLLEKSFKDEIELNSENIDEYLCSYFDLIKEVIQNKDDEIEATKERLSKGLENAVAFLNDFRKNDDYEYLSEEGIKNYIWKLDDNTLVFNGSIDRLDIKDNRYRIIDYKSSEKSVSIPNVKKGINFQLLTYLVLYYLQSNRKDLVPELFAYLSLKNSYIDKKEEDGKYEKSDEQLRRDDIKYSAYLTSDINPDDKYFKIGNITGLRNADDKRVSFDEVKQIVEKLFLVVSKKILSGDIAIDPKNSACTFCKYSDICHYNGEQLSISEMEDLVI